jgi:prophage regulatory protein
MTNTNTNTPSKILRMPAVCEKIGIAKPTLFVWIRNGKFPKPIKLSVRATGWRESDIDQWISERETASRVSPIAKGFFK